MIYIFQNIQYIHQYKHTVYSYKNIFIPLETFFWISSSLFIPSGSRNLKGHLCQQRRIGLVPKMNEKITYMNERRGRLANKDLRFKRGVLCGQCWYTNRNVLQIGTGPMLFISDEGPMLETLDITFYICSYTNLFRNIKIKLPTIHW